MFVSFRKCSQPQKPDPISDHNCQNLYPFSDQNGSKTIPFGAAHTYIPYIGSTPPGSWPCGSSVNDGIPSGSFLGEFLELSYPTIDAIVSAIISLGRGCMLFKRDLRKVYRQFPVDPHDYHLLGYTWNSPFYFDTVLTVGLRSTAMACQRSTSAITWILNRRGLSTFISMILSVFPRRLWLQLISPSLESC